MFVLIFYSGSVKEALLVQLLYKAVVAMLKTTENRSKDEPVCSIYDGVIVEQSEDADGDDAIFVRESAICGSIESV